MPWTVYRWDDAGAPTLTGQAGTYDLITVLDACLVTGYGAKPAAGWTKPFTGTGKVAFRQGTGSNGRYLRVDCSSSGQYPRLRSYDTMSDVDTGTNPMPTDAQISGGGYTYTSSATDATQRAWVVFADAKRFYLWVHPNVAAGSAITDVSSPAVATFFGDFLSRVAGDAYNTAIICGTSAASTTQYRFGLIENDTTFSAQNGHFIAGTYQQVAGSIACSKLVVGVSQEGIAIIGGGTNTNPYPDPITTGMALSTIAVMESATLFRGTLPGVYAPLHDNPASLGDTISGSAAGGLTGKSFILLRVCSATAIFGRALFETSDTVG